MTTQAPDAAVTMLPDERRSVGVVALIAMIRMFGLFALLPVLSLYAADLAGATPLLIGLAVGAYGLTQAGLQIPLGALSDRIGRLPVIVGGLAVFALGSAVAAMSDSIHGVIAGRLLQGAGAISSTLSALVTDATREDVRTRGMAVFGIGVGLSFMLAMVAGPLIAAQFGVGGLFWIAAGLSAVAAGLLLLLPKVPQPETAQALNLLPAFRPDLLRMDFYVLVLHTIMTATFVALPILLSAKLQLPLTRHWQIYVGALLLSLAITVPLIMNDDRSGKRQLLRLAVLLLISALLILTFASFATWTVFIALTLYFGGFNFLEAGLPARLSILAADEVRGASLGVYSSAQFLGAFVGGLIGGRFLGGGRPEDVFFVCALLAAIWLAMQGFGARRRSGSA